MGWSMCSFQRFTIWMHVFLRSSYKLLLLLGLGFESLSAHERIEVLMLHVAPPECLHQFKLFQSHDASVLGCRGITALRYYGVQFPGCGANCFWNWMCQ